MGKNELKTLQIINAAWTSVCYTQNLSIPKYCCAQSHSHEYSSAAILYSLERSQQNGKQNEIDQIRTTFQISLVMEYDWKLERFCNGNLWQNHTHYTFIFFNQMKGACFPRQWSDCNLQEQIDLSPFIWRKIKNELWLIFNLYRFYIFNTTICMVKMVKINECGYILLSRKIF